MTSAVKLAILRNNDCLCQSTTYSILYCVVLRSSVSLFRESLKEASTISVNCDMKAVLTRPWTWLVDASQKASAAKYDTHKNKMNNNLGFFPFNNSHQFWSKLLKRWYFFCQIGHYVLFSLWLPQSHFSHRKLKRILKMRSLGFLTGRQLSETQTNWAQNAA